MNILGKRSDLPFSRKSDRKKEKCTVSSTHEQSIIRSQTQLDRIAHEQTIICRSRGGLSANEKKEKFASNDNNDYVVYWFFVYYSQSNWHLENRSTRRKTSPNKGENQQKTDSTERTNMRKKW